ncbi:MAG: PH domain-containing protein [Oscillospiraceae bacterium]
MSAKAKNTIVLVLVLVVFLVLTSIFGGTGMNVDFGEDTLTVTGPKKYSFTVDYDQIASLELAELTEAGTMISGGGNRSYYWGSWENDAWGRYTLCAAKKTETVILITTREDERLAFNYQGSDTTASIFQMFNELLEHRTETETAA